MPADGTVTRRPHEVWHDPAAAQWCERAWDSPSEREHRARLAAFCAGLLRPGDSVLEVGCGTGLVYGQLVPAVIPADRYTGVDVALPMLDIARQRHPEGDFRQGDGYALDFPDGSFAVAACFEVLGHLPEVRPVLSELLRVSARVAVFTVWPAPRGVVDNPLDELGAFQRSYSGEYLRAEIAAAAGGEPPEVSTEVIGPFVTAYIMRKKDGT